VIGLDTNVLVRLLTGDDPKQRAAAKAFIAENCSQGDPAFINRLVLIETVWVLESVYGYTREQIAAAIDTLLRMVRVLTEDADLVRSAVATYRRGADFADALIAGVNTAKGCSRTATFDRTAAKKIHHFVELQVR
jgi:predicted nucleic-acid-binding protein